MTTQGDATRRDRLALDAMRPFRAVFGSSATAGIVLSDASHRSSMTRTEAERQLGLDRAIELSWLEPVPFLGWRLTARGLAALDRAPRDPATG